MGYTTDNIHAHSRVAVDNESPRDTIENAIQYRAVKLAVIAAEISYSCRDIEKVDQGPDERPHRRARGVAAGAPARVTNVQPDF